MTERSKYLEEAIRIGDELIQKADNNEHGISWRTPVFSDDKIEAETSDSVYGGTSGIALFLLELYKQAKDPRYLQHATKALEWVTWYCDTHRAHSYAFLTGRMGPVYALLQLYKVAGKKKHLKAALTIAASCQTDKTWQGIKEYINGQAGTVLCSLHLHAASGEPWILEALNRHTQTLIADARSSDGGLYWDSDVTQIRPLCGFSHGTSGIGFVFLELGRYFDNPALYAVADRAFAYENAFFDAKINNWPDFRLHMWNETQRHGFEEAYRKGDLDVFTTYNDANAWCHGAAGIGLSRIHANLLTKNKLYKRDVRRALAKTRKSEHMGSFTLCHGDGGNADIFIESYLAYGDTKDLDSARHIGDKALEHKATFGRFVSGVEFKLAKGQEDFGLLNGVAGVGYFFLRLHDPRCTPSILAPVVPGQAKIAKVDMQHLPFLKITQSDLQRKLTDTNPIGRYKAALEKQRKSSGLLFIQARLNQKKIQQLLKLSDEQLLRESLQLVKECRLVVLDKDTIILLKLTATTVEQQNISPFCYTLLRMFIERREVAQVMHEIFERYNITDANKKELVQQKALAQLREALAYGILILTSV